MADENKNNENKEEKPLDKALRETGKEKEFEEAIELHKTYGGD